MRKIVLKKELLKKMIRDNKLLIKLYVEYQYLKVYMNKGDAKELEKCIREFVSEEKQVDKKYIRRLKKDILYCKLVYFTSIEEYFFYRFEKLNEVGRNEYVGKLQLTEFWDKFNKDETHLIFLDKEKSYQAFKEYYGREVIKIESESDYSKFVEFTHKHPKFIMKPLADHKGNGVKIIECITENVEVETIFNECLTLSGGAVLEEVIIQAEEMAKFHPESVNTIRFVTFYNKGVLNKICAVIRMGRNGSCIDNACAGGIYATIDMETGIIDSPGTSHTMEKYFRHPDTNAQILGAQIPYWEELNELVEKVVIVVPEMKQVGWDFALTDNGWVIVEGNDRPMIQAFFHNRGLRREFQCMFDAYNA